MLRESVDVLTSYIDALCPIIYIVHFDFKMVDDLITKVFTRSNSVNYSHIIEYNNALGVLDFKFKTPLLDCDLEKFLKLSLDDGFENETFIVLKDIHEELKNPKIIALLRRISENNLYLDNYNTTIFIVSSKKNIPSELRHYISVFDLPLPNDQFIEHIIDKFAKNLEINVDKKSVYELVEQFRGLNEFQINNILTFIYQDGGYISTEDKNRVFNAKKEFVEKTNLLKVETFVGSLMTDVGGLNNIKDWLLSKEKIFKNIEKALEFGLDIPKGMVISGMPGSGKTLISKTIGNFLSIPTVTLNIDSLINCNLESTKQKMRFALKMCELLGPCVLFIDEIENIFKFLGKDLHGNNLDKYLITELLDWIKEASNTVFTVVTSNHIDKLPSQFFRKEWFDELFFVDLPNFEERKQILYLYLNKKNLMNADINLIELSENTEGFNGADLEFIVNRGVESIFVRELPNLTTLLLLNIISETKPVSQILKDEIHKINKKRENISIKLAN